MFEMKFDVFIGIDVFDFNFIVEEKFKVNGIKIIYYVSFFVWVWW